MPAAGPLYLLDTNIFVHAIRGSATWHEIKRLRDPLNVQPRPIYSVVTEGELGSLAEQWNWGDDKRVQAEFLLGYFDRFGIDEPATLSTYARIDAESRKVGVRMGKNDLWIAAAAQVTGAILLTTDADFDHLNDRFFVVERVEPQGS